MLGATTTSTRALSNFAPSEMATISDAPATSWKPSLQGRVSRRPHFPTSSMIRRGFSFLLLITLRYIFETHGYAPTLAPSGLVIGQNCSGNGLFTSSSGTGSTTCQCHSCFTGDDCSMIDKSCIIDLNQGDPTMFEKYWLDIGQASKTVILGWEMMSYYADSKDFFFVLTELDREIRSLHEDVGNAVTQGRHIVVGVGSTQLYQAALYALSSPTRSSPMPVTALSPYYSTYPAVTDFLKSALFKWGGDAATFNLGAEDEAYIEIVTTPNNPTGEVRYPVVNGTGAQIYDLAYYWPHHTPLTTPADEDVMLFTLSKCTGHAGTRIGWAIVKDFEVAKRMANFVTMNTIGVSKDAQIRATQILRSVRGAWSLLGDNNPLRRQQKTLAHQEDHVSLFYFGKSEMSYRWERLREVLQGGVHFALPEFKPEFCTFFKKMSSPTPAFAWLRCLHADDCAEFLRGHGILTRGGLQFGADASFARLSMLDRRARFEILIDRLSAMERQHAYT